MYSAIHGDMMEQTLHGNHVPVVVPSLVVKVTRTLLVVDPSFTTVTLA